MENFILINSFYIFVDVNTFKIHIFETSITLRGNKSQITTLNFLNKEFQDL